MNFKIEEHPNGRSYLMYRGDKIAECVNGDHKTRYGNLAGWLKHIQKRTDNRLVRIEMQARDLERERQSLLELDYHLYSELRRLEESE